MNLEGKRKSTNVVEIIEDSEIDRILATLDNERSEEMFKRWQARELSDPTLIEDQRVRYLDHGKPTLDIFPPEMINEILLEQSGILKNIDLGAPPERFK